jgi:biopolymer transport protein ExbD
MLALLIIFVLITPMLHPAVPVNLARTNESNRHVRCRQSGRAILPVMRDGKLFLDSESVTGESLVRRTDGIAHSTAPTLGARKRRQRL